MKLIRPLFFKLIPNAVATRYIITALANKLHGKIFRRNTFFILQKVYYQFLK